MLRVSTKVEGFEEMHRLLKALPPEVERKVIADAARATSRQVAKDFKEVAPRADDQDRSPASQKYGHMVDNIRVKAVRGRRSFIAYSKDAFWAQWYEFGNARQPPRPVFRPVWDRNVDTYLAKFVAEMSRQLALSARRLAGKYRTARKTLGVK